jgi:hypothetical protein
MEPWTETKCSDSCEHRATDSDDFALGRYPLVTNKSSLL